MNTPIVDMPLFSIQITGWMDAIDKECREVIIRLDPHVTVLSLSKKYRREPLIDIAIIAKWNNGTYAGVAPNDIVYVFTLDQIVKE